MRADFLSPTAKPGAGCSCSPIPARWHQALPAEPAGFAFSPLLRQRLVPRAAICSAATLLRGESVCLLPCLYPLCALLRWLRALWLAGFAPGMMLCCSLVPWYGGARLGELPQLPIASATWEAQSQDVYGGGGELGHGEPHSSCSSEGCEGLGLRGGVYSSSSCSLFLLGFAAQGYCRAALHRKEEEVFCFKLIMGAGEECVNGPGL